MVLCKYVLYKGVLCNCVFFVLFMNFLFHFMKYNGSFCNFLACYSIDGVFCSNVLCIDGLYNCMYCNWVLRNSLLWNTRICNYVM